MGTDHCPCFVAPALQERQIEQRIDDHPRAAWKHFALLEAEILLVEIAELLRFLRNKRDVPQFTHSFTSV
jgi:hypothetical protein